MAAYTAIDNPELYFQVKAYTGTDASPQAFTLDGDEDMQPDLVWIKNRGYANKNVLFDSVRGVNKSLTSDSTAAEVDQNSDGGYVSAFGSDGFTLTEGSSSDNDTNDDRYTYVAWCWKESATAGFDIVAYTGASGDQTFAHSLGVAPDMYIVKERGNTNSWVVNHKGLTNQTGYYLLLNSNDAQATDSWFNATAPTSSVVSANDGDSPTNRNGGTYIMYLFAGKQGFSKFGSYIGNGNADGTYVHLGFRPSLVILKATNTAQGWFMVDSKRSPFNPCDGSLHPNATAAEDTSSDFFIDLNSNGFKLRDSDAQLNGSYTYMYMAFAEAPFVNSKGVPCNAR